LKAGASGYVVKSALRKELVEIIRSVHGGERHLDADIATRMAFPSGENVVSNREADVLRLIALGHSNRETGLQLGISEETVKTHLKGVFGKLRVTDRTHAVIEAIRRGIIEI
jgi:DNA-binding NarL/FixJ family response regulator